MWPRGGRSLLWGSAMEVKEPTTFEDQLCKLKKRGCIVSNDEKCLDILRQVNYYRFSAYFLPFKTLDDQYIGGIEFFKVFQIYEFDRRLRGLLFSAIEEIEVYLRTQLSYYHVSKYGALGYKNKSHFNQYHKQKQFEDRLANEIEHNRNTLIVKHHNIKYDGNFPLWVATEFFTFGMLSRFFSDLKQRDQKSLAKKMYKNSAQNIRSWLRCCADLRNICAHYGRLYYRTFTAKPAASREISKIVGRSRFDLFDNVLIIKLLHPNRDTWNNNTLAGLTHLIIEYKDSISMNHIGFPDNWEHLLRK